LFFPEASQFKGTLPAGLRRCGKGHNGQRHDRVASPASEQGG
jgi:hypothetical protein